MRRVPRIKTDEGRLVRSRRTSPRMFPQQTFSQGELAYMHIPATEAPAAMAASASIA